MIVEAEVTGVNDVVCFGIAREVIQLSQVAFAHVSRRWGGGTWRVCVCVCVSRPYPTSDICYA
jgi:hypothetical protein